MSMTEHQIETLENFVMKYEDSTDPKHIHLVEFAKRRLEEELEELLAGVEVSDTIEEGIPSKWNVNDNSGHDWSSGRTYTYVPSKPVGKSMLRQACKSLAWKTPRAYVWK